MATMSKEFGYIPLTWTRIGDYSEGVGIYLCDKIVAVRRFDLNSNEWNGSELQRWLNCEFYRQAFTDEHRKKIVGNETTHDCVFLLSIEEVVKYKPRITRDHFTRDPCPWWLRSPGYSMNFATTAVIDGDIYYYSYDVNNYNGVRPAILLKE
jgi:hypothetical protein